MPQEFYKTDIKESIRRRHCAKARMPKGMRYFFLDHNNMGHVRGICACVETNCGFDEKCFRNGNYFISLESAKDYVKEWNDYLRFRTQYLEKVNMKKQKKKSKKKL